MPPRTRNQIKGQQIRGGRDANDFDMDYLDEQHVVSLLHDDDSESEEDQTDTNMDDEEDDFEEEKKGKTGNKNKDASQTDSQDSNDGVKKKKPKEFLRFEQEDTSSGLMDPLAHVAEYILTDRETEGGETEYLVKYKGLSYAKCKWLTEDAIQNTLSFQCVQKLKRFKVKKEKNLKMQIHQEEEEDFDKNYLEVDKVISSSNLFPIIHPRQAKNIIDTWRERCIDILQLLANYRNKDHCYGVPFFFLRTEDRTPMDFTTINNRLYTIPQGNAAHAQQQQQAQRGLNYTGPYDFWNDIGLIFKENQRLHRLGTRQRTFLNTLREMAYHLYCAWHQMLNSPNLIEQIQALLTLYQNYQDRGRRDDPNFQRSQRILMEKIQQLVQKWKEQNQASSQAPVVQTNNTIINNLTLYIQLCGTEMSNTSRQNQLLEQIQSQLQGHTQQNKTTIDLSESVPIVQEAFKLKSGEEIVTGSPMDFRWLLESDETIEEITRFNYFNPSDVKNMLTNAKQTIDIIYLVKWKNLSYTEATWEPHSVIKQNEAQIKDFERFNRSLDQNQRSKLMGFALAHRQLVKIFQKKQSNGKKLESKCSEETQTREMMNKLQKFETKVVQGQYFQYDFENNLVPQFKAGQVMKDYQIAGLNWILRAWQDNRNIVLADEMGLGKTIMTISFLDHLIKICKIRGPFLVIAPLSTLDHWKRVAEEWTYMNVVVYHDSKSQEGRLAIQQWEWYYIDVTNKGTITQKSKLPKFNLMITSYEVFNQDLQEHLKDVPFLYVVVDEAHRLKNKQTKTLQLLKEHPCRRILLLTGTPVQNNTKELHSLLNYIEPDKFNNLDNFLAQYGKLETADQVERLHKQIRPHFLRRMKDEVENSIPPLKETVIDIGLTQLQQTYYKGIYGENLSTLAAIGSKSMKLQQLNNIDMQLRKCCNHLFLLQGVDEELTKDCKTEAEYYQKLMDGSGKLILLDKFIEKYRKENHKMLIFSQFTRMIDIIKEYLEYKKIRYEILTGSVKSQDRGVSINRFNEDNEFGVFLLTTKAGGLGINLTKARVVVIFDSDWNPQNDLQAIARAHRIGQQFEVSVYRFITAKTYEQQMFERASRKLGMEQALFQKGLFSDKNDEMAKEYKVDPREIEKLLKYGAYAFLDEDNENPHNVVIDDLLSTKKKSESKHSKHKSGQHIKNKATFNVNEGKQSASKKNVPHVNDPNFWEKILPFEGFNPKQLMRKFRAKKADIMENKDSQSKFMKEVSKCVKDLLEAKSIDDTMTVDEELYELLKKIQKTKNFENKYRDKATVLLNKILHFQEYQTTIIRDQVDQVRPEEEKLLGKRNLKRTAKANVDYTSKKKRDKKGKGNTSEASSQESDETDGANKRRKFGRLCKDAKKQKDEEFAIQEGEEEEDVEMDDEDEPDKKTEKADITSALDKEIKDTNKDKKLITLKKDTSLSDSHYQSKNHCSICEKIEPPVDTKCNKNCKRYVHFKCAQIDSKEIKKIKEGQSWECKDCKQDTVECFACKKQGQVIAIKEGSCKIEAGDKKDQSKTVQKCGMNACSKYYHKTCLANEIKKLSTVKQKLGQLKCLLHYCAKCKLVGGEKMIECAKCPKAYHKKCLDDSKYYTRRISKRFLVCSAHKKKD